MPRLLMPAFLAAIDAGIEKMKKGNLEVPRDDLKEFVRGLLTAIEEHGDDHLTPTLWFNIAVFVAIDRRTIQPKSISDDLETLLTYLYGTGFPSISITDYNDFMGQVQTEFLETRDFEGESEPTPRPFVLPVVPEPPGSYTPEFFEDLQEEGSGRSSLFDVDHATQVLLELLSQQAQGKTTSTEKDLSQKKKSSEQSKPEKSPPPNQVDLLNPPDILSGLNQENYPLDRLYGMIRDHVEQQQESAFAIEDDCFVTDDELFSVKAEDLAELNREESFAAYDQRLVEGGLAYQCLYWGQANQHQTFFTTTAEFAKHLKDKHSVSEVDILSLNVLARQYVLENSTGINVWRLASLGDVLQEASNV